ncbi:MAG: flagellar export chaperone FliS [Myxococcales bacterium]|nr:flagellar export chaperone FliS [Myxococcales bacterium]
MYAKNGYAQSSFQRYRAVKIQTASPAQIMIMLYDGAIRFALIAKKKIDEKDYAAKGTYIGKVQAIISELMSSLDFSIAPELCTQLEQLYIFMMEQLTEANLNLQTDKIDTVVRLLRTLRDSWNEALGSLPADPTAGREATVRQPRQVQRPGAPRPPPSPPRPPPPRPRRPIAAAPAAVKRPVAPHRPPRPAPARTFTGLSTRQPPSTSE